MPMKTASLKARLARSELTLGSWITLGHPAIAEILARAGFDWLAVDMEHTSITIREAEDLIRAIELCGSTPLVRLTSHDADLVKRVLDCGAHGVIAPSVNTRAQAERIVASTRYPPRGFRGVGLARAQGYGARFAEYRAWADKNVSVVVMIEHEEAVRNVESILSVDGVDACFIGPYDLSASMGLAGQFGHPEVSAALERVRSAAKAARIPAGIHVVEPDAVLLKKRIREGFRFLAYGVDTRILDSTARAGLAAVARGR